MAESIHELLENISFIDLEKKIALFDCKVSFFRGRKFYLEGYEGDLSFNKLIYIVSQKARAHPGSVDGHKLYENLNILHEIGEAELSNQPFWTRFTTLIKRAFTYLYRLFYLNQIYDLTGYSSFTFYCERLKDKFVKDINVEKAHLLPNQLNLSTRYESEYGHKSQVLMLKIDIPHSSNPLNYVGLNQYYTEKKEDPTKLYDTQFENLINELNFALPFWFKSREQMDAIALEIRNHIDAVLTQWRSKKNVPEDCEIEAINFNIETTTTNTLEAFLTYSCSIKFKKTGNHKDKHPELFLKKVTYKNPDQDSMKELSKAWNASVDSKIDLFIQKSIEKESAFSNDAAKIFFEFFGIDFDSYYEDIAADGSITINDVQDAINAMEALAGSPGILTPLFNEKKYKELETALKKVWKKGALKLHPDKAKQDDTEEAIKKATDDFKKFADSYFKASKWVNEQLQPSDAPKKEEGLNEEKTKKQDSKPATMVLEF